MEHPEAHTVFGCVLKHLVSRDLARMKCVNKHFYNTIPDVEPIYVTLINNTHYFINEIDPPNGMYTIDSNDWQMRISFINNGERVRMDFRQSDEHKWVPFGKFQPRNMKQLLNRAIRKERQIKINGVMYPLETILTRIAEENAD